VVQTGVSSFAIENDAPQHWALLGERHAGAARGCDNVVMITAGDGDRGAAMIEANCFAKATRNRMSGWSLAGQKSVSSLHLRAIGCLKPKPQVGRYISCGNGRVLGEQLAVRTL